MKFNPSLEPTAARASVYDRRVRFAAPRLRLGSVSGAAAQFGVKAMKSIRPFLGSHSVEIQAVGWCVFIVAAVLDGYLDLPHPFSVPLSAYLVLVGAPLLIAASLSVSSLDSPRPKSLRNFIRASPWMLGSLWVLAAFLLVGGLVSSTQMDVILHQR